MAQRLMDSEYLTNRDANGDIGKRQRLGQERFHTGNFCSQPCLLGTAAPSAFLPSTGLLHICHQSDAKKNASMC